MPTNSLYPDVMDYDPSLNGEICYKDKKIKNWQSQCKTRYHFLFASISASSRESIFWKWNLSIIVFQRILSLCRHCFPISIEDISHIVRLFLQHLFLIFLVLIFILCFFLKIQMNLLANWVIRMHIRYDKYGTFISSVYNFL